MMRSRIGPLGPLAATVVVLASGCASSHPVARRPVIVVQTSRDLSQHLERLPDRQFVAHIPRGLPLIAVDDRVRYQRILGVGAAITDSAAWLLERELSPSLRAIALRRLFGPEGIDMRIARIPIGASDFTRTDVPYSYDDIARGRSDPRLTHFSVAHDDAYIVPLLRDVRSIDDRVQTLATPWSPPPWMKSNKAFANWRGSGRLLRVAYAPLAGYFVKFIQAYARRGVPIDAITPQNEPGHATHYPGGNLAASDEATLISRFLVPALSAAGIHPKIYGLDSSWSRWSDAAALSREPQRGPRPDRDRVALLRREPERNDGAAPVGASA